METNQATLHILKPETIEVKEHFFNIDVKQEIDEEVHSVNVINELNGETYIINSIKQEVNVDLNTNLILEECKASIKQESNIDNIESKFNYSKGKRKITKLIESQSNMNKKLKIYSEADDFSDDDGSQNEIKTRRKIQNKIRCKRYRDKKKSDTIFGLPIYENQTVTLEEVEVIKRRKEYNKQKSKRYRDRKKETNVYKAVRNVSTCQNFDNQQITGPPPRNESYILKSYSDYDITSQVNHYKNNKKADALVDSLIYKNRTITVEEDEEIKRRKEYNKQKSQRYRDRKRAAHLLDLQTDIRIDTLSQVKNVSPYKHTNNETTDIIVESEIYKNQIRLKDEEIKRRKEYNKQKSQRYRDRKRAAKLINLLTDQSSESVASHVSKCKDFHTLQNAVSLTRNVPYSTDLSTPNEPYIPESHSDYDDTSSQVPQFLEPIITIYVPNTQNLLF